MVKVILCIITLFSLIGAVTFGLCGDQQNCVICVLLTVFFGIWFINKHRQGRWE
jgi:hypothetical protein